MRSERMTPADDLDPTASFHDLFIIATAPAGWYEVSPGVRRWFDGRSWTDYYAPVLTVVAESLPTTGPAAAKASASASGASELTGTPEHTVDLTNHGFHLIMTVMTLAAWTPVWLAAVAVTSVRSSARRHSERGQRALVMRSTRRSKSLSASSMPVSPSR